MKILSGFLILTFVMALVLPIYTMFFVQPAYNEIIKNKIKEEAYQEANYFVHLLSPEGHTELWSNELFDEKVRQAFNEDMDLRDEFLDEFRLKKLKVYTPDGKIIYSTVKSEVGQKSDHQPFDIIVGSQKYFTDLYDKQIKNNSGQFETRHYIGIYVPVIRGKKFIGAFEMYYDITEMKQSYDEVVYRSTVIAFIIMFAFFGIAAVIYLKARKAIRERDNAEKALITSERHLQTVLLSSPDVILTLDQELNVKNIFTANSELLWELKENIIDRNLSKTLPESAFQAIKNEVEKINDDNPSVKIEYEIEVDGVQKNFGAIASQLISATDEDEKIILVSRDETEQKRIERLKEDVEHIVRHDLKTPLNGIIGFSDLLLSKPGIEPKSQEYLSYINSSGYQMLHMINHSLDLFKMEEGSYQLNPVSVDLVKVFQKLDKEFSHLVKDRQIELRYNINGEKFTESSSCFVLGEQYLIESLFANLIKNAIEASPSNNEVTISIQTGNIVIVDVHNQGMIPEMIQERFFDRYVTSGKKGGTGLGTYSARLIVNTHKGDIRFRTSESEGTHLIVSLIK